MRKLLFALLLMFSSIMLNAQTVRFNEDFESLPIDFDTLGSANWDRSSALQSSGMYSDSARIVNAGDTAILVSIPFSTVGDPYVYLEFDQICKIPWTNNGTIQVSADSGQTWLPLLAFHYKGDGQYGNFGNRFTSASYVDWMPAIDTLTPQNSWWKHELFDISTLVGNTANVMIRFMLNDQYNTGSLGNYAWLIDNVKVISAIYELNPPVVELIPPFVTDTAYYTGPFEISSKMQDDSGIDTAYIVYTYFGVNDTIGMNITASDTNNIEYRMGSIPSMPYDSSFCYKVVVIDASGASNISQIPTLGCQQVTIVRSHNELSIGLGGSTGFEAPIFNDSINGTNKYSQHISLLSANDLKYREADFVKLAWKKANSTGYLGSNAQLKIYIKHTSSDTVDTAPGAFASAKQGATLVYDSTGITIPTTDGLIDFVFNTDTFHYDGMQNILLLVDWFRPDTLTNNSMLWQYSLTPSRAVTFAGSSSNPSTVYALNHLPNTVIYSNPTIYKHDIGVYEIVDPNDLVISNNIVDVKLRIKNYGSDTIHKMNIYYSIDGQSPQAYAWTGQLNRDLVSNDILVGSETVLSGSHSIISWTTMPNDSNDMYLLNDTMQKDFYLCNAKLSGTYTIGGATADFPTFKDAEDRLNNCGISASVVFYINPGTYNEHIHIKDVLGASANKTITFMSSTANADDVLMQYDAQATDDNYLFKLDGASWLRIKHLSFHPLNIHNSRSVLLMDSATNNIIEHCKFSAEATSNAYSYGVNTEGEHNNANSISNNQFTELDYSVQLSSMGANSQNNIVKNNRFINFKRTAIYASKQESMLIESNYLYALETSAYIIGIQLNYCGNDLHLLGNDIDINVTGYAKGIYVNQSQPSVNNPILIANNFVSIRGMSSTNGRTCMDINFSSAIDIYHNSFSLSGGGTSSRTVYLNPTASTKIANNIFSNFSQGLCYEVSTSATFNRIVYSDHNDYYTAGAIFGNWGYNNPLISSGGVGSLTALNNMDSNSVFTDPLFYSASNLHSFSSVLNNAGVANTGVIVDIDGEARSATSPDIGADEYTLSNTDAGIIELLRPLPLDTQSQVISPKVVIRNFGNDTINSMPVKYQINGGTVQTYNYVGLLSYAAVDTISLPSMTVPVLSYQFMAYTQLSGDTIFSNDSLEMQLYGMPLVDVEMLSLEGPVDACDMDTNEIVKVKIHNKGLNTINSGLSLSYQLVGSSSIVTETISAPIAAGADYVYTFNTKVDLSVNGVDSTFIFKLFSSHAADPIPLNDTIYQNVLSLGILSAPVVTDTTINYGNSVTLTAQSPYNTVWYADDTTFLALAYGATYTTPQLFDTTIYYVESNTNVPAKINYLGMDTTTNTAGAKSCVYYGGGATHQILILASELQNMGVVAGDITSLAFYIQSTNYPTNHSQFTIKMGNTTATSLTTTFISSGLTQVYQQGFQEQVGWNIHNFSTPFSWDGTSNVVIDFLLFTNYSNPLLRYTTTSFNSVAYNIPYGGGTGTSNERPNIRFNTSAVLGCAGARSPVQVNVPLAPIEAQMNAILSPNQSCGLDTTIVECQIVNMGTDTIPGGFTVSYQVNTGSFITPETVNTEIAPGDTLDYIFNTLANLPSGPNGATYAITAAVSVVNDFYSSNDSIVLSGIWSEYSPAPPTIANTQTVNYGDSVNIFATANDTVYWYWDMAASSFIDDGASITIGPLFDTTQVYARSQKTVPLSPFTIGNGTAINTTSAGPNPYGAPSYQAWGLRNQFLIRASEMRAMGMIKGEIESLAFNVTTPSGTLHKNYTIKIGSTSVDELNSFVSGLSVVFASTGVGETAGWNTYNFSTPFYWDGVSNIVVETCFKNTAWVTSGYAKGPYTNTSYISTLSSYSGSNFSCSDTIKDNLHYKRPNIKFTAKGYGSCVSSSVMHQVNIQGIPAIDAGIYEIVSPGGTISSGTAHNIEVVLRNYGTDTLNSVSIKWMDRDQTIHTYSWTGQLLTGELDTVLIASHSFLGGQTRLFSWTDSPNSITDTIPLNDTAFTDLDICMQGIYTIGAGMNYPSLHEAFSDMLISSLCGAVTLAIDSGIYQDQYVLSAIPGVSAINNITITSIANDSTKVHLTYGTSAPYNYVLKLNNSPYVSIKGITFNPNGGQYSNAIVLVGNTHHINIENCVLNSGPNANLTAQSSGVHANGGQIHDVQVVNNVINNGSQAIYFLGTFSSRQKGMYVAHNIINGFNKEGVFANYQDSIQISYNDISSGLLGNSMMGIYLRNTINTYDIRNNRIIVRPVVGAYGIQTNNVTGTASQPGVVANNMISILNGSGSNYGVYIWGTSYSDFVYNSVNVLNGTANNKACLLKNGTNVKLLNNIFYTRKGRIMEVTTPASISTCDYNAYYTDTVNNLLYVKWINDVNDLSALQTIDPNNNTHSLSVDPLFYADANLHAYGIELNGAAIPIVHTNIDFDMETRNTTTPDIGADEFILSPIDLGVVKLIHPESSGCDYTFSDSLVVQIKNYGTSTINFGSLPAVITLYSTGINPDTISFTVNSGSISTGSVMSIKISNSFNLTMIGQYIFDARIDITGDGNALNDAMATQIFYYYQAISTFPFTEDFESGASLYLGSQTGSESQMSIVSAAAASGSYGMRFSGGDFTSFTPNHLVDLAYAHTDHVARLYSCQIDATNLTALNLRLDLKQTYYANANGSWFRILIFDQNGAHYAKNLNGDSTFRPNSQFLDSWATHTFVLNDYVGQVISVYMEAAVGATIHANGMGDNVFVDNISIWSPVNTDISMKAISSFDVGYMKTGTIHYPEIAVENYGASTITSIPISYSINGQVTLWDTIAVSIGASQSDTITMNTGITILSGVQELCIIAHVPGDSVASNDTICAFIKGLDSKGLNFDDDFEGPNQWFAKGTHSQWELGAPNSTNFQSAYSGQNAFVTVLSSNYQTESIEYLYSPYFVFPVTSDTAVFEFMQKMQVQSQLAYGYIQYSFNGQLWLDLGYIGSLNSNNWYNTNINGKHSWSLQSNNWIASSIALDPSQFNTGNQVQFRFVFRSFTATQVLDGWMIDDVKITLPSQQFDAGVDQIILPDTSSVAGLPATVEVRIHNYGYDTLTLVPVAYRANQMAEIVETWSGSLLPDSTVVYTFANQLVSPMVNYTLCAYTKLAGDINTSNDGICKQLNVTAADWDAAVVDISEQYQQGGNIISITVTNLGVKPIVQLPVSFDYGSYNSNVENLSQTLNNGDTLTYTFTQMAPVSQSPTIICGYSILPNDMVPSNDQLCKTTTGVSIVENSMFVLNQNRPNPFSNNTVISYSIPKAATVHFRVLNILGEIVYEEQQQHLGGDFSKAYNFSFLTPGIYYYSIIFEGRALTKKMIVQ